MRGKFFPVPVPNRHFRFVFFVYFIVLTALGALPDV